MGRTVAATPWPDLKIVTNDKRGCARLGRASWSERPRSDGSHSRRRRRKKRIWTTKCPTIAGKQWLRELQCAAQINDDTKMRFSSNAEHSEGAGATADRAARPGPRVARRPTPTHRAGGPACGAGRRRAGRRASRAAPVGEPAPRETLICAVYILRGGTLRRPSAAYCSRPAAHPRVRVPRAAPSSRGRC